MRRLVPWLLVAVVFGLVVPLALGDADDGAAGWLLPVVAVGVAAPLFLVLHECGHLLAAKLLRLPVVDIRIRPGGRSYVRVRPGPSWPALPVRMTVFFLAGPATDLALTAGLFAGAAAAGWGVALNCLIASGLAGAVFGVGNLVPHRPRGGIRSDGGNVLLWVFRPARQRAAIAAEQVLPRLVQGTIDDAELAAFIDGARDRPAGAAAAYGRWCRTLGLGVIPSRERTTAANVVMSPAAAADFAHLRAYVLRPEAALQLVVSIVPTLGIIPGLGQLHRVYVDGEPADRAIVDHIAQMADLLRRRSPDDVWRLTLTALTEVLRGRPSQAVLMLRQITPAAVDETAWAVAIRAVAESAAGDPAGAERLLDELRRAFVAAGKPEGGELPPVLTDVLLALASPVLDAG